MATDPKSANDGWIAIVQHYFVSAWAPKNGAPREFFTSHVVDNLYTAGVKVPMLGFLRDTQNYVHLAAHGLTLWDVASTRFQGDREQWEPIITWVN